MAKQVTKAEYDANQKARESFVDQATQPKSKFTKTHTRQETLRSEGKIIKTTNTNNNMKTSKIIHRITFKIAKGG